MNAGRLRSTTTPSAARNDGVESSPGGRLPNSRHACPNGRGRPKVARRDVPARGMRRPLILLDVDGVLNALDAGPAWDDWQVGKAVADGRAYRIHWSPSVVARVLRWTEVAEVQWLTTWGHDANQSLRQLLRMPELPVAGTWDGGADAAGSAPSPGDSHADVTPAAPDALTGRWWKFDVVRRLLGADPERPLVWLDDDLLGATDMAEWTSAHARSLLVAPDPVSGLTVDDLQAVDEFLGRWARGPGTV